ncbi:MAG: hypothetical protein KNN13_04265 [Hydrogenobacter thermophilus]|uniref:Lipoprotein n=1 Tax=Hydrogenobacter thermophilus (strain DSM 6534 / IAM 12695 / TK-6) TaxID=608538 RepID=D3DIN8_HYDTT|nr:hypothetical protein [Hydrogenobacter thermophilus]QWK20540.1 MAG: hypothetical protein KNN13_04265 [Hydrogenobacter thermophilus]BAI69690.1 hypothetical protein HTH_1236 [Hydrogenobacter thermophilus TK-6]
MCKRLMSFIIALGLFSCTGKGTYKEATNSWCPKGVSFSGITSITVEGIVDYEELNWCKVVITSGDMRSEIYFTQDGSRQRWVQYKGGTIRSETQIRKTKAIMRIYDERGNLIEEVRSKEAF